MVYTYIFPSIALDYMEAFASHPRLGKKSKPAEAEEEPIASDHSLESSSKEQAKINEASSETLEKLAAANAEYEKKFDMTFIACASGKSASEVSRLVESTTCIFPRI